MIGGKVLDPSALAAHAQGSIGMLAHLTTARLVGTVLYLPETALNETLAVYRHYQPAEERLDDLRAHPCVVFGELTEFDAGMVAGLLHKAGVWDVPAAQVVLIARARGWPVLTADPGRLTRIAPDLDVDLL